VKKKPLKPLIVIVSPALASANNGNWHTAARWARFLRPHYRVDITLNWHEPDSIDLDSQPAAMIALHARRSADSIARFAAAHPSKPLMVALTGTDVYRDIQSDVTAKKSLKLATHLITLQDMAVRELPQRLRARVAVIYQSARSLSAVAHKAPPFTAVMVGHLRDEKDPATFMRAAVLLNEQQPTLRFEQIGNALEPELAALIAQTQSLNPSYRWLGNLPRATARQHIRRAHVLVIPSRMEGGANVIIEAVTSGTAVLASRISGNIGMLGRDYAGYFELGNAQALAALIERCSKEPKFLTKLQRQCAMRAPLFAPSAERSALTELVKLALSPLLNPTEPPFERT
jgi:putative glycosyltransferase (TIGR04348 family)